LHSLNDRTLAKKSSESQVFRTEYENSMKWMKLDATIGHNVSSKGENSLTGLLQLSCFSDPGLESHCKLDNDQDLFKEPL